VLAIAIEVEALELAVATGRPPQELREIVARYAAAVMVAPGAGSLAARRRAIARYHTARLEAATGTDGDEP
jgi:hypothetical protein